MQGGRQGERYGGTRQVRRPRRKHVSANGRPRLPALSHQTAHMPTALQPLAQPFGVRPLSGSTIDNCPAVRVTLTPTAANNMAEKPFGSVAVGRKVGQAKTTEKQRRVLFKSRFAAAIALIQIPEADNGYQPTFSSSSSASSSVNVQKKYAVRPLAFDLRLPTSGKALIPSPTSVREPWPSTETWSSFKLLPVRRRFHLEGSADDIRRRTDLDPDLRHG